MILTRLVVFFVMMGAASCASNTSVGRSLEPGPNAYGAFLAARYASVIDDDVSSALYYQRALKAAPRDVFLLQRAFGAALTAGDVEAAVRLAGRAEAAGAANPLGDVVLAMDDIKRGRYKAAQARLAGRDGGSFTDFIGQLVLAWAHSGARDHDKAVDTLKDLGPGVDAFGEVVALHRAVLLERAGRASEAERAFKQAMDAGRMRGVVVDAYGRTLERAGRTEDARALYAEHLAARGGDIIATDGLARLERGERPGRFAPNAAIGAASAVVGPAASLAEADNARFAAVYLRLALYLDPGNALAREALASLLIRDDQEEEALEVLAEAGERTRNRSKLELLSGWALLRLDRPEEAITRLEALVRRDPAPPNRRMLADAYRAQENYRAAVKIYSSLLDDQESAGGVDWSTLYARGTSYERLGAWALAETDLTRALELAPNQASVLNYLGYGWVDRGENLEQAFNLIRKAVALRPDAGHIVDSLGWAYYRLEAYDKAVLHLERAVALSPGDAEINDHLGDAYWRAGRTIEAVFQWERVLTLNPSDDRAEGARQKIQNGLSPGGGRRF